MKHYFTLFLIVFFIIPCCLLFSASKPNTPPHTGKTFSQSDGVFPGVVIVKFKRGVTATEGTVIAHLGSTSKAMFKLNAKSIVKVFNSVKSVSEIEAAGGKVDLSNIFYVHIDPSLDPKTVSQQLRTSPDIEYAEPKYVNYIFDVPNDSQVSSKQTSAFTRMNAFNGWTIAKGDSSVVIADVDGGTDWQHHDLKPNLWINSAEDINHNGRFDPGPPPLGDEDGIDQDGDGFADDVIGWNFANNSNDPRGPISTPGSAEHGTNTASIFGARTNNGIGMAGSSWNCSLMPICVASPTEDGKLEFAYEGITYAYAKGANVINCSFGREGNFSQFEQDVITAATQAGALVVASAGNGTGNNGIQKNNDVSPSYPANYKYVLGVGATTSTSDNKPGFSNYGITVPVYAPGLNIWTASSSTDSSYGFAGSGTSFSAPFVSGLAGIVKSLHPTWTPRQVATQIRITSDSIDNANSVTLRGNLGHGRVNYYRAFTESHPGIEILTSTILTTKGKVLFLPGDTIILSMTVQNILFADANNLAFTATTSDPTLQVLQGSATISFLAQGNQATLPDFKFVVGALGTTKDVAIKLLWISNINDRDGFAFKVTLFPSTPLWLLQDSPAPTSLTTVHAVNQNVVWAGGGNQLGTAPVVIRTTDGGTNWALATSNLPGIDIYCLSASDENHCWVGTGSGSIYATTNAGISWAQQAYPGTQTPFMDGIWFFDANNGYAVGDPATGDQFIVLNTTNGGQSWSHVASEPVGGAGEAGWNNSFWWTDINHGWFGTNLNKIWRTTNGGTTWSSGTTDGNANCYGVSFKDDNTGVATFAGGAIMVSGNGGVTWTSATSPTTNDLGGVSFLSGTNSAWVTDVSNPYRSTNNGATWSSQSLYPFSGSITHLTFSDTLHGWAVTSNGEVLAYNLLLTSVDQNPTKGNIPDKFSLDQNYPNPFNPRTTISYDLPVFSKVALKVFDVLGREVSLLVNSEQSPGRHTVSFDASHLASGIYFYRIFAVELSSGTGRQFTASRKFLLLK